MLAGLVERNGRGGCTGHGGGNVAGSVEPSTGEAPRDPGGPEQSDACVERLARAASMRRPRELILRGAFHFSTPPSTPSLAATPPQERLTFG